MGKLVLQGIYIITYILDFFIRFVALKVAFFNYLSSKKWHENLNYTIEKLILNSSFFCKFFYIEFLRKVRLREKALHLSFTGY